MEVKGAWPLPAPSREKQLHRVRDQQVGPSLCGPRRVAARRKTEVKEVWPPPTPASLERHVRWARQQQSASAVHLASIRWWWSRAGFCPSRRILRKKKGWTWHTESTSLGTWTPWTRTRKRNA
ncbi:unnamed protein product [Amoebophrya sp. A25]|nr:unnamed protein product [Amoebophrya sp. A25]|eukprot:GSA25T00022927001.1